MPIPDNAPQWLKDAKTENADVEITSTGWVIWESGEKVKIGCKEKTFKEWDAWFKSKEECDTKRTENSFKIIHAYYKAVKTYIKYMKADLKRRKV